MERSIDGRALCTVAALLVGLAGTAAAQQPLRIGTAAALGGTAVTEARRVDAMTWNPALVGIWDGPTSSHMLAALDVTRLPSSGWLAEVGALGLFGRAGSVARSGVVQSILPGGREAQAIDAGILWGGFQSRSFAVGLASYTKGRVAVPRRIGDAVLGRATSEENDATGSEREGEARRATSTVLTLSKAFYHGRLPGLGYFWTGLTAKGWYVHELAEGGISSGDSGNDVFREVQIRGIPGYGIDLGVVAAPALGVRLGASVSNVYSGVVRPRDGARERLVSIEAGEGGSGTARTSWSPPIDEWDEGTSTYEAANTLWGSAQFPVIARLGAAVDSPFGTFAFARRWERESGALDPIAAESVNTWSYRGPRQLPVRLSHGWGGGVGEWGLGVQLGGCRRVWTISASRRQDATGSQYGVSGSLAMTDLVCYAR